MLLDVLRVLLLWPRMVVRVRRRESPARITLSASLLPLTMQGMSKTGRPANSTFTIAVVGTVMGDAIVIALARSGVEKQGGKTLLR